MASLNISAVGPFDSTSSTPSYQSEYVDAPTTPSSTHHRPTATATTNTTTNTTTASSHALPPPQQQTIDYFDLSPVNRLPRTELQDNPARSFLGDFDFTDTFQLTQQPILPTNFNLSTDLPHHDQQQQQQSHHLHNLSDTTTIHNNNYPNDPSPYHLDNIRENSNHRDEEEEDEYDDYKDDNSRVKASTALLTHRYSSSRTQEQVGLRTNPIDNDRHTSASPSSDDFGTKLVLKNIVPSLKGSDSDLSDSIRSARAMSFASLPGTSHMNIDEIPLNSTDEAIHEAESSGFRPSRGFMFAFGSICIITLAVALDATSLAIALPIITGQLHGTAIEAFWAGTSFLITSAVFQPIIAGLSHIFGRKELILLSSLLFAIGSILGAVANNFAVILTGRSIQGMSVMRQCKQSCHCLKIANLCSYEIQRYRWRRYLNTGRNYVDRSGTFSLSWCLVWIFGLCMGHWLRHRSNHGCFICPKSNMEVDFLDQPANCHTWSYCNSTIFETRQNWWENGR